MENTSLLEKAFADSKKPNDDNVDATETLGRTKDENCKLIPPLEPQENSSNLCSSDTKKPNDDNDRTINYNCTLVPPLEPQDHSSSLCPLELALLALECSLSKREREMYGRRYENQYDLTQDNTYNTWKKYKDMLNESTRASEDSCMTSLNTSDLGHETNIIPKIPMWIWL